VAEGEEEIARRTFRKSRVVPKCKRRLTLRRRFHAFSRARTRRWVTVNLGAKGIVELEMTSSGELWGRGPRQDIHSSNKARVDSPAWHLVQALNTLVSSDGNDPAIDGFSDKARPLSAAEKTMVAEGARRMDEAQAKRLLGVERWVHDSKWQEALERLVSRPTVNIQGLVGGYTGPGGKTILPHRAVAKLDLRLVPDMTAAEALAALKSHLARRLWRHRSPHDRRLRSHQHNG
jgi:acetylornithine deacetylase/succinyl-diaminopimelate desuccinylase-like protein